MYKLCFIIVLFLVFFAQILRHIEDPPEVCPHVTSKEYPNTVMQTMADVSSIPPKVHIRWNKYAPGVNRILMSDDDCIHFLRTEYDERYAKKFVSLRNGAHKADLMRYAWLYKRGGVYMDIKTELIMPFDELFPDKHVCYLVVTRSLDRLYNGIIATPPGNPMIYEMLEGVMQMSNIAAYKDYFHVCKHGWNVLSKYARGNVNRKGLNIIEGAPNVYVYEEVGRCASYCNYELDKSYLCMFVVDGEKEIIKVRFHDYPWKSPMVDMFRSFKKRFIVRCLAALGCDVTVIANEQLLSKK